MANPLNTGTWITSLPSGPDNGFTKVEESCRIEHPCPVKSPQGVIVRSAQPEQDLKTRRINQPRRAPHRIGAEPAKGILKTVSGFDCVMDVDGACIWGGPGKKYREKVHFKSIESGLCIISGEQVPTSRLSRKDWLAATVEQRRKVKDQKRVAAIIRERAAADRAVARSRLPKEDLDEEMMDILDEEALDAKLAEAFQNSLNSKQESCELRGWDPKQSYMGKNLLYPDPFGTLEDWD